MDDQERRIFRYWNGGRPVNADPVTIRRRLTIEMGGSPNLALRDWYAEIPEGASEEDKGRVLLGVAHAEERLVAAARVAFALPPFDAETGAGAMDQDAIDALEAFVQFEAEQKKRRYAADLAGTYGAAVLPQPVTAECLYGLWLNAERVRLQRAISTARGVDAALASEPLSDPWFDAACLLEEEAEDLKTETNLARRMMKVKARLGWGV